MFRTIAILLVFAIAFQFSWAQSPNEPGGKKPPQKTGLMADPGSKPNLGSLRPAAPSMALKSAFTAKKPNSRGITYIYPPYMYGWTQQWQDTTGYVHTVKVEKDKYSRPTGYTAHVSSSYAYGMASSRCWIAFDYTPNQTGNYRIGISCFQEGNFRMACGNGGESYCYRNIGVMVEGIAYQAKTVGEMYLNRFQPETPYMLSDWSSVERDFFLEAGRTYKLCAYSEVGGWTSGNSQSYQIVNVNCALGPFVIEMR